MKRILVLAGMAFALAGCGFVTVADAKKAVANKLIDPKSAQFRDVSVHFPPGDKGRSGTHGDAVCGWVNAKNTYGGYTGFKEFVVPYSQEAILEEEAGFPAADLKYCTP